MTSDQFTYWLQGFTELHGEPPTAEQWASIKEHLSLVFHKVTPPLQQPAQQFRDLLAKPLDPSWLRATPQCAAQSPALHGQTLMVC